MKSSLLILGLLAAVSLPVRAGDGSVSDDSPHAVTSRIELLKDGDFAANWYVFLKDRGRDLDPKHVFTAEGNVLKVSGAEMGCVTTRKAYRDYRLSLEYRNIVLAPL